MPIEEIMKVARNYQVTIPVKIRDKLKIREGDLVRVIYDENEGVIKLEIVNDLWK